MRLRGASFCGFPPGQEAQGKSAPLMLVLGLGLGPGVVRSSTRAHLPMMRHEHRQQAAVKAESVGDKREELASKIRVELA